MASFGKKSRERRDTCNEKLRGVLDEAIKHYDFSIVWGHRGREAQNKAFEAGRSKVSFPRSKHNSVPSDAVDITPYPMGYEATYEQFYEMATYILHAASALGVRIRWGGHWKNYTGKGPNDRDWAHFEIME